MTTYAPGTSLYNRHVVQYLTNYWEETPNSGLIGDIVAPRVQVQKMSDKYIIWGTEHFNVLDTYRADRAESKNVAFGWSDDSYQLFFHALNFDVSQAERENADSYLSPEFRGVDRLAEMLAIAREKRVATLIETTASVIAANRFALTNLERWSAYEATESDPFADIRDAKNAIHAATRRWPNCIIIPYPVSQALVNHPKYQAKYKNMDSYMVTNGGLLSMIEGLWVIEPSAGYNTAKDGQTASLSDIWTKTMVHVCYIDGLPAPAANQLITGTAAVKSSMDRATFIRTFEKSNGRTVRSWQLPWKRDIDVFEVEECLAEKVTSTSLAARITNVIAA